GAIQPGVSGPLFWDEPESNLNPKLLKLLVEILLEIGRMEQQIIVATHDYFLLRWFDLLQDKKASDQVRFHALFRDKNEDIRVESAENYLDLSPNAIADSF